MTSGVYRIINLVNNKVYIGSSVNLKNRWRQHRDDLRDGRHINLHLQRAWDLYSEDAFVFEVCITCHATTLLWYEQQFLDQWQPEYNVLLVAGSPLGCRRSEETRRKVGEASAKPYPSFTAPDGTIYPPGRCLLAFCREHKMDRRNMWAVARGRIRSHRGWILTEYSWVSMVGKPYPSFVSPDGTIYPAGRNLAAFCRRHGLKQNHMWDLAFGKQNHCKGWRRRETSDAQAER